MKHGESTIILGPLLLNIENLRKSYSTPNGLALPVVDVPSFSLSAQEHTALCGTSGSGKTTLARVLVGLQTPNQGDVLLENKSLDSVQNSAGISQNDRWKVQMVFQDPYSSLNPMLTAKTAVAEAIQVWTRCSKNTAMNEAIELLGDVGIPPDQASQLPGNLSGGQRQRVSVARALAPKPKILIADEPTSSIDQSAQAQLLNLLRRLQEERKLAIIFISHDLNLIRYLTSRVYVMQKGDIVEQGPTEKVFLKPSHPYTQTLIQSIPGSKSDTTKIVDNSGV